MSDHMPDEAFLIIDAGSGSVKSLLLSPTGEVIGRSERFWSRDKWSSDQAWGKITQSVHEVMKRFDVKVLAVSATAMREEFVLLDQEGAEIVYDLCSESERHGYRVLEEFGELMYTHSGRWPVPNWMAGAVLPWLKSCRPNFYQVSSILMISDFVNFKLTGKHATESSSACETGLFNILKANWNWEIIESLGLPETIFPEVLKNGEILGYVGKETSKLTGVPYGVPVVIGGADTQCGLLGMGAFNGELGAVGGTTTPVQIVVDKPVLDPEKKTWTNNYLLDGTWVVESNVGYTGRALKFLLQNFMKTDTGYEKLDSEAEKIPLGSYGVLAYLGAHLFDSGPPYMPIDRLGDLPVGHTLIGEHNFSAPIIARAIYESNSYGVKLNLEKLVKVTGLDASNLKFCGGNSKSDVWMQIQSDVLGVPVHVPVVRDASAVGAASLAASGAGYYHDVNEAVSNMVKTGKIFEPNDADTKKYETHFRRWAGTRERLCSLWR